MDNIIEINHVKKQYNDETVLNDVTVSFERGKIHGIVGNNGSGKTVLFKSICGLIAVNEGEIRVNGKQIGKDVDIPDSLGIIIESPGFLPHYSGYENLRLLASVNRKIGKNTIAEVMDKVGLDPKNKKHVGKYSLGMRQRLGIAQAIMENPELVILDEPMNGLDKNGVKEIRKLLLSLKEEGKTILLASHNKEDIEILCDEVYEMDAGNIKAYDVTFEAKV